MSTDMRCIKCYIIFISGLVSSGERFDRDTIKGT